MRKFAKTGVVCLLFFILGLLVFIIYSFYISKPKLKGEIRVQGLTGEVRIITDRWGVPHIFAQNEKDLFFACGYVHARERMWQMDVTRRAGAGRLAEIFGSPALVQDKLTRNLGLKEAALRDMEKLNPQAKEILSSYSRGINSWIESRKINWPPEFLLLRYRPAPWQLIDSLLVKEIMAVLLCGDYPSEVVRANLLKKFGPEKTLQILESGINHLPSETEGGSLAGWLKSVASGGSNNWVIAGSRTESGKPLLANDPHLEISLPSVWYEIHLDCPTLHAVGVSLPGVPLVIIGHNDSIAWGTTNSWADVQDIYIEKLDSSGENFLDGEEWKPLKITTEFIKVRGHKKPETMEVRWTRRGPVISPDFIKSRMPFSLRWTIYEGGRTLEAMYRLNKAGNWKEFSEALSLFDAPSQNFVYADKMGNIGYYLTGKIPIRREEAALFPYPGWREDGNWEGYIQEEEKPNIFNPADGVIVTANNKIIPDEFPHYVSVDWDVPFRASRIREMLLSREKHTLSSMQEIQNDVFSKKGELFREIFQNIKNRGGSSGRALAALEGWDFQMGKGKGPALFQAFMHFFQEEVFKDDLGSDFEGFDFLFQRKLAGLLSILSNPLSPWFDNTETPTIESRDDAVQRSLAKAYDWLMQNYGPEDRWDWTEMHSLHFRHILGQAALFRFFNRGPYPMSGDAFTVRATYSNGFRTTHSASFRQVLDLSDWKKCVCVLTSGQSGHVFSRFYDDQIPLWLNSLYHPMLFSKEDIEKEAYAGFLLKPAKKSQSVRPQKRPNFNRNFMQRG